MLMKSGWVERLEIRSELISLLIQSFQDISFSIQIHSLDIYLIPRNVLHIKGEYWNGQARDYYPA